MQANIYTHVKQIRSEPAYFAWFAVLVLLRPVFDTFYDLKHVSVFASPLYWIGAGTPILVIISTLATERVEYTGAKGSLAMTVITWLIISNVVVLILMEGVGLEALQVVLKITLLPFIYYYSRKVVNSIARLNILVSSFAYGSIFVYGMILYEQIFGNISSRLTTGGIEVASGMFADSVSYGMYINIALIAWSYKYYHDLKKNIVKLSAIIAVSIIGLVSIGHLASLACSVLIVVYLISTKYKGKIIGSVIAMLFVLSMYNIFSEEFRSQYSPKITRELEVFRGERDAAQGFHGRMTRWSYFMDEWYEEGLLSKALGVSMNYNSRRDYSQWLLVAPHNDYMRIGFMIGLIGLSLYIYVVGIFYVKAGALGPDLKFLGRSAVFLLIIYSFTTLPSLYPQTVYFIMTILSYMLFASSSPIRPQLKIKH